jgi:hypothetical protein
MSIVLGPPSDYYCSRVRRFKVAKGVAIGVKFVVAELSSSRRPNVGDGKRCGRRVRANCRRRELARLGDAKGLEELRSIRPIARV